MKKIIKWSLPGMMMCTAFGAGAQQINPITEAVLQNYAEILAENPQDYLTLYDRASQYFDMGDYDRALSDIDMALTYTPEKEKEYRQAEYSLKGDILTAKKLYPEAIEAVSQALALNPVSQGDLYKAGNLNLLTNRPQEALAAFQALQRENPRSQEAFYGMAKANAMMGKIQDAENLIKEVESLGKQSFVTYCRIGDLYSDMGNIKEAATNYAIAYTMEDHNTRPVESLKMLARKNPATVMETLEGIINAQPDNIAPSYLKAIVAFDGGNFAQAENACKGIAAALEEESPAIYRMMAMSQLAQNKTADAAQTIEKAERLAPSDPGVLLDKADIFMALNPETAYQAAVKAQAAAPEDNAAMLTAAKTAMLTGRYPEAQGYLNNIVLTDPSNAEALLLRGYLYTEYMKDGKTGISDYTRASNIATDGKARNLALAALGKSKINKTLDADGMINEAVAKAGNNKDDLYWIAVYYAQTGNLEKAKEFADKAMINGYSNLYNLQSNNEPLFNLQPIRHLMGK